MTKYTPENIVKLNVGGTSFATFHKTLIQSKFFENLLNKDSMGNNIITSNNEIFIDRSGKLFDDILYYLRTNLVLANDVDTLRLLQEEAKYYQLDEMADAFEQEIKRLTEMNKQKRSLTLKDADSLKGTQGRSNYVVIEEEAGQFRVYKVIDVMDVPKSCRVHHSYVCQSCSLQSVSKLLLYLTNKQMQ